MRITLSFLTVVSVFQPVWAQLGKCIALGRVAGESQRCAKYDNTDEKTCQVADGEAWCRWKSEAIVSERGTGPVQVVCQASDGSTKVYHVNSLRFQSETGILVAIGFGPNRQDDGIEVMSGNCEISSNLKDKN